MSFSNFPNGFPGGITIRGVPVNILHPGEVFYVNNSSVLSPGGVTGSDGNDGSFRKPFKTIDFAVGACTADRGDIIMVMPGHAETIADATTITLDVDGIAIVGMGTGSLRPTLTYGVANSANITFSGDNMSVYNILFVSNFLDVASALTATGTPTDFTVQGCEFRATSTTKDFLVCVTGVATDAACDGLQFNGNKVYGLDATTATHAVSLLEATDHVRILDNFIMQPAIVDNGVLMQASTFNHLDIVIARNIVHNPATSSTGGVAVESAGNCTGFAYDNMVWALDASAGIWITTGSGIEQAKNYCPISAGADLSAVVNPVEA